MEAYIYRPNKSVTQSGLAKSGQWILECKSTTARVPEPLMGWTSCGDTLDQVHLKFDSLDAARAFADKKRFSYTVFPAHVRRIKPRNYGDNFCYISPEDEKNT
ncbi:MAG: ETC complex I subunit [Alphaproteobacteria bacterium]|nr:ETC complex I subunit [Alphaproteobacteria bacterium]